MRNSTPDPAICPQSIIGESYVYGHYMYENSRIVRNQVKALNIKIHSWFIGWSPQMRKTFKKLEAKSKELVNNPEAIKEYEEAARNYERNP